MAIVLKRVRRRSSVSRSSIREAVSAVYADAVAATGLVPQMVTVTKRAVARNGDPKNTSRKKTK